MLLTLTASHHDLDLDVLEQLSTGAASVGRAVVADSPDVTGCVVLATCNRFEVYADVEPANGTAAGVTAGTTEPRAGADGPVAAAREAVTKVVAMVSGVDVAEVAASFRVCTGDAVSRHLFTVAAGLDSMVVGEREVAGQVRRALDAARSDGTTTARLERLFQVASRTARQVGARTGLGGAGRSVVGVALDLVAEHVDLARARVLLIGTGSYAGASLSALRSRGVRDVAVYSPSGRAGVFAAGRDVDVVREGELDERLSTADVVVSCSGASGPVVDAAAVRAARARRAGPGGAERPTVLVDLALRHDIEPAVAGVPGVVLVDLAAVQRHAPSVLAPEVGAGLALVEEAVAELRGALAEVTVAPAVTALRGHAERLVADEVERLRRRGVAEDVLPVVERSLRRTVAAALHGPTVRARELAREGRADDVVAAVRALLPSTTDG